MRDLLCVGVTVAVGIAVRLTASSWSLCVIAHMWSCRCRPPRGSARPPATIPCGSHGVIEFATLDGAPYERRRQEAIITAAPPPSSKQPQRPRGIDSGYCLDSRRAAGDNHGCFRWQRDLLDVDTPTASSQASTSSRCSTSTNCEAHSRARASCKGSGFAQVERMQAIRGGPDRAVLAPALS